MSSDRLAQRFQPTCRLFVSRGSSPLLDWQVNGEVRQRPAPAGPGFVYEMVEGSPATRIQMPSKGSAPLGLRHQRLVLDVWGDPILPFAVEVVVCDAGGVTRTVTLSRDCMAPEMTHGSPKAKLPLAPPAGVMLVGAGWRIVDLDLADLIPRAFDGAVYKQLDGIAVVGACMLRTIDARAESPPVFLVADHVPLVPHYTAPGLPRVAGAVYVAVKGEADADFGDEAYDGTTPSFASTPQAGSALNWQGATKKLGSRKLAAAMLRPSSGRRHGDPRSHATGGFEDVHPAHYRRETRLPDGKFVPDTAAVTRSGVAAAQELCMRLRRGDAPPTVDMTGVAIGEGGTKLLTSALASKLASSVNSLTLAFNNLGDRGAALLASSLRANFTLTALDLQGCAIGTAGGVALAGAVEVGCPRLSTLNLSRNALGAAGVAALVRAAAVHTGLALLDLEHTGGAIGLRALFRQGDEVRFEAPPSPPMELGTAPQMEHPTAQDGAAADPLRTTLDRGAPRARVVHVRTGRPVPRLDDGPAHDGRHTWLLGLREEIIGRIVHVNVAGRPAVVGAFVNVATNEAVEALRETLLRPVRALRTLRLGGNLFGAAARDELKRVLSTGPNGANGLALQFQVQIRQVSQVHGGSAIVPAAPSTDAGARDGAQEAEVEAAAAAAAPSRASSGAEEAVAELERRPERDARRFLAEQRRKAAERRQEQQQRRERQQTIEYLFPEIELQREQLQRSGTWAPEPSLIGEGDAADDNEAEQPAQDVWTEMDAHLDEYLAADAEPQPKLAGSLPGGLSKSSLLLATASMNKARVFSFAED